MRKYYWRTYMAMTLLCVLAFTGCTGNHASEPENEPLVTTVPVPESTRPESEAVPSADTTEGSASEAQPQDLDRVRSDLSVLGEAGTPEWISQEEFISPCGPGEIKTARCRTAAGQMEMGPFCRYVPETDNSPEDFDGRRVFFVIPSGNVSFKSDALSSGKEYAYAIRTLAQREYRSAEKADRETVAADEAFIVSYIVDPTGECDIFWIDQNRYLIHQTGEPDQEVSVDAFTEVSREPLSEEDFHHLYSLAVWSMNAETDIGFCPFQYNRYAGTEEKPSGRLEVHVIRNEEETVLPDDLVDKLVTLAKETDAAGLSREWSTFDTKGCDESGLIRIVTYEKGHEKEAVPLDDFCLTNDGFLIRKYAVRQFGRIGGADGIMVKADFVQRSAYPYPFKDCLDIVP